MGNERRYFYDYYMLCCGPLPLGEWVEKADRAVAAFAADGALIDAPAARWRRRGDPQVRTE